MDGSRRENDAEHAWHLAVMALVFSEASKHGKIDMLKVLTMILIHDIVEIDTGDAFYYDEKKRLLHKSREEKAARRIFNILPKDQAAPLIRLWQEFEARRTPEARFAAALDRFQPILHNYRTRGRVWKHGKVSPGQVLTKNAHIQEGIPLLWEYVQRLVKDGVKKGYFKRWRIF